MNVLMVESSRRNLDCSPTKKIQFLFGFWGTQLIGVWRPKGVLTVIQCSGWVFFVVFFFLYSEITQRPVNVLKSVSVCIKLLYI